MTAQTVGIVVGVIGAIASLISVAQALTQLVQGINAIKHVGEIYNLQVQGKLQLMEQAQRNQREEFARQLLEVDERLKDVEGWLAKNLTFRGR